MLSVTASQARLNSQIKRKNSFTCSVKSFDLLPLIWSVNFAHIAWFCCIHIPGTFQCAVCSVCCCLRGNLEMIFSVEDAGNRHRVVRLKVINYSVATNSFKCCSFGLNHLRWTWKHGYPFPIWLSLSSGMHIHSLPAPSAVVSRLNETCSADSSELWCAVSAWLGSVLQDALRQMFHFTVQWFKTMVTENSLWLFGCVKAVISRKRSTTVLFRSGLWVFHHFAQKNHFTQKRNAF